MTRFRNKYALPIYIGAIICIIARVVVQLFDPGQGPVSELEIRAAHRMAEAITVIRTEREAAGIIIDRSIDPNHTGLIGPRRGPLATTLGNPAAKRTTTNPDMAGLITSLLIKAGVGKGDVVAISASASFPALMVASVIAAETIGAVPLTMISFGASSFGLTDPGFHMLDLYRLLRSEEVFGNDLTGISLGGKKDTGLEFSESLRKALIQEIEASGVPYIYKPDLRNNVASRMQIYMDAAEGRRIAAFINCGGSYYDLGTHSLILTVKPGLNKSLKLPPDEFCGMLYEMASQKIPVIHLLNIRELVRRHGIEWDPSFSTK